MKNITKENFNSTINGTKPVVIDFWAEWCGPCRMLSPIIEELVSEVKEADIYKCNVDEAEEIASSLNIQTIPTLILFRNGEVLAKRVGAGSKAAIKEWLDSILK